MQEEEKPLVVQYVDAHTRHGQFLDRFLSGTPITLEDIEEENRLAAEVERTRKAWDEEMRRSQ